MLADAAAALSCDCMRVCVCAYVCLSQHLIILHTGPMSR